MGGRMRRWSLIRWSLIRWSVIIMILLVLAQTYTQRLMCQDAMADIQAGIIRVNDTNRTHFYILCSRGWRWTDYAGAFISGPILGVFVGVVLKIVVIVVAGIVRLFRPRPSVVSRRAITAWA